MYSRLAVSINSGDQRKSKLEWIHFLMSVQKITPRWKKGPENDVDLLLIKRKDDPHQENRSKLTYGCAIL